MVMEIKASILDYLGKYEGGILVSVCLTYKDKFYNSIFYYTDNQMTINVEESMTQDIGYEIEDGYNLDIFEGCDVVMCGDIHKRGVLIFKEIKEIHEEELYVYEKIGWVLDE